jgi:hypothetical protein
VSPYKVSIIFCGKVIEKLLLKITVGNRHAFYDQSYHIDGVPYCDGLAKDKVFFIWHLYCNFDVNIIVRNVANSHPRS